MLPDVAADPAAFALRIAFAAAIVAVAIALWFRLMVRVHAHGGRPIAGVLVAAGIAAMLLAIVPGILSPELGFALLFGGFVILYRPDLVVRATGGPRIEWRALRAGRELVLLRSERDAEADAEADAEGEADAEAGAARREAIRVAIDELATLEAPSTSAYLSAVRAVVTEEPGDDAASRSAARVRLDELDGELRASLGARPTWERELQRRAAGSAAADSG